MIIITTTTTTMKVLWMVVVIAAAVVLHSQGFVMVKTKGCSYNQQAQQQRAQTSFWITIKMTSNDKNASNGPTAATKAIFGITEVFGRLTSASPPSTDPSMSAEPTSDIPHSFDEISQRILEEYQKIFWATGNMDVSLWSEQCLFADPFNSFGGPGSRDRFKANADNLGKFVINPTMKITSFDSDAQSKVVKVGWTYRSKLALPWKPILAAAGETIHVIEQTSNGLQIVKYQEQWKSKPWDVVKRLFVPSKDL